MTHRQLMKVRCRAFKFFDNVVYENQDWNKRDIALKSFQAGAEYALENKYDELKEDAEKKSDRPNIVQFLKDNGVYEMFFANLLNRKQGEELGRYFLQAFFASNAILCAFTWSGTPEGHYFWEEISDKWENQF